MTAFATRSVPARADTPVDVAAGEAIVSRLEVVVPVESDVDGLEIECDGALVPASSYGVALPLDAGAHVLVARAPGRLPWSTKFSLARGSSTFTVVIPRLSAELVVAPPSPDGAPATATTAPARATLSSTPRANADRIERDTGKTERTIGLVLGGVGLAGVAVGTWLAFDAAATKRELWDRCGSGYCSAEANGSLDRYSSQAGVGDALLFLGLASSVGAAIVFLTAPSGSAPERRTVGFQLAPAIAPGGGSVVAAGKF